MASYSSHFIFLILLCISHSISSSPSPLYLSDAIQHLDPFHSLGHIVSTSVARAHHIKNPQNAPIPATPLSPYSGAYSISLSFGTPAQSMPLAMDTGSSFSWFPCTKKYLCRNCSVSPLGISSFIPKQSSSARILGCLNPKCSWVHGSFDPTSRCQGCGLDKVNCTRICPPYMILYGLGSTGGVAMMETLNLPHKKVPNFVVGCSFFSSSQPQGVAGFGRGIVSFPSQLGLKKFSYCLVSHKFDNAVNKSSLLLMDSVSDSGKKTKRFRYTRFLKNPIRPGSRALADYYYVGLRKITVGGEKVKVRHADLTADSNGNGGTIVDSGSTFTYMNQDVFSAVGNAFLEQVKEYMRAGNVEALTRLKPCFDVTGHADIRMPEMVLHFKGGSDMALPLENYFLAVKDGKKSAVCLSMVTDDTVLGSEQVAGSGPSVILGNLLMQNFHVEFDLRNERFGFRQESCS